MLLEQADELLKPGYMDMETGYMLLPDGQMFSAVLSRMPNCKGKMVEWFFSTYLRDTATYKEWDPKAHLYFKWDEKWSPGHHIGASHEGEELMGGTVFKFRVKFVDPASYFDISKFKEGNIGGCVCGEGYLPDGTLDGRFFHLVRDTDYGCEIRSRFWIYQGSEEMGKGHMTHGISEMGTMADILPGLYRKYGGK